MRRERGYWTTESGCRFEPMTRSRDRGLGAAQEAWDRSRVQVQVRVHEADPLPACLEAAELQCISLAEVAVVVEDAHAFVAKLEQLLLCLINGAVRDDDQLEGLPQS